MHVLHILATVWFTFTLVAEFLVQFLEYMTWFTVELISTTSYSSLGNGVYEAITNNNAFTLVRWQDGAVDEESVENIKSYYETLKKEARSKY